MVDFPPGIDFEARDKSWFGDGPLVAGVYGWKKRIPIFGGWLLSHIDYIGSH